MHQRVEYYPPRVSVHGMTERIADYEIQYWGFATLQPNGKYACHANVAGSWCIVEVTIKFDTDEEDNA